MRGTQATQEPIRTGRAQRVVVTAVEGTLPAHADGETLCTEGQRLEMELLPSQIEMIYQPTEAAQ
jgi:diacylglycerol kinase (ATP)